MSSVSPAVAFPVIKPKISAETEGKTNKIMIRIDSRVIFFIMHAQKDYPTKRLNQLTTFWIKPELRHLPSTQTFVEHSKLLSQLLSPARCSTKAPLSEQNFPSFL